MCLMARESRPEGGHHCRPVVVFDDSHVVALHLLEQAAFEASGRVGVEGRQAVSPTDSGDTQFRTGNGRGDGRADWSG